MNAIVKFSRAALAAAIVWLFVAGMLVLQFWPSVPHTAKDWVAFIAFGPPLYVLGELLSERLWSTRPARALATHPSSGLRILVGVVIGAAVVVCGVLLSLHFG